MRAARLFLLLVALSLMGAAALTSSLAPDVPFFVPEVVAGYAVQPLTAVSVATAFAFGPGDA